MGTGNAPIFPSGGVDVNKEDLCAYGRLLFFILVDLEEPVELGPDEGFPGFSAEAGQQQQPGSSLFQTPIGRPQGRIPKIQVSPVGNAETLA
jgi:hypothetical protein